MPVFLQQYSLNLVPLGARSQVESVIGDMLYDHGVSQPRPTGSHKDSPTDPSPSPPPPLLLPTLGQMVASRRLVALFAELPCSRDPDDCSTVWIGSGLDSYW